MMADIAIRILIGLGTKIMTETFLAKVVVHSLKALVARTDSKFDDQLITDLAEALGVQD